MAAQARLGEMLVGGRWSGRTSHHWSGSGRSLRAWPTRARPRRETPPRSRSGAQPSASRLIASGARARSGRESARNRRRTATGRRRGSGVSRNRRQVLAERNKMDLVVAGETIDALVIDHLDCVVDRRPALAGQRLAGPRRAGDQRHVRAAAPPRYATARRGVRPSRKGKADSGQIRCVTFWRPGVVGAGRPIAQGEIAG